MSRRAPRVFGTTEANIARTEAALGKRLPPSFREWLVANNNRGLHSVEVFTIADDRDPQTLLDSIEREYEGWQSWLEGFVAEGRTFEHLLPFASFGTGDYYCFHYSSPAEDGECPVVLWSHETGETEARGGSFPEFVARLAAGEFSED